MNRNLLISNVCLLLTALAASGCGANITASTAGSTTFSPTASPMSTLTPGAMPVTPGPTNLPTPTPTASPKPVTQFPASSSDSGSGTKTVTRDNSGQTITLQVGERFLLNLGDNMDWQLQINDPTILSRVPNVLTIKGSQGLFEGHRAGQTTLTATGDLTCRKGQPPCSAPSFLFQLQIVVASGSDATPSSQKSVTLADNGQTITLRVGESFLVNLGDTYNWDISVADPSIVSRVINIAVIRGAQGVYEAKSTGETILNATGVIVCPPLKLCPDVELAFKLHIVVH